MTAAEPPTPSPAESSRQLPPAVRARVIAMAAETLGAIADEETPAALRAVRRFTPAKRARLGAASIAGALETEPSFRAMVVERIREALPALVTAIESGTPTPAASPDDVAAVAYLLNAPDWRQRVEELEPSQLADPVRDREQQRADRLQEQLTNVRAAGREESARLREDMAAARRETDELRRRVSRAETETQRAAVAQRDLQAQFGAAQQQWAGRERELSAEIRRLRLRLRDAEASAAAARRGTRSEREGQTARLRVLLDTLGAAATGLRRELDLPPVAARPADLVAAEDTNGDETAEPTGLLAALGRGRAADDPALVDDILTVPGVHVIVDGYNVTKLGYPSLTLEDQRARLLGSLSAMAARASGAEITCVFDATAISSRPLAQGSPRGVRVLFSAAGELADELIVRLVAAEPRGRPVVVVTNDREVIDAVRHSGGETLPSGALLARNVGPPS